MEGQQFTKFFVKIIVVIVLYGVASHARTIVAMLVGGVTMLICLFKTFHYKILTLETYKLISWWLLRFIFRLEPPFHSPLKHKT